MRFGMAALMLLALAGVATPRVVAAAQTGDCAGLDAYMTDLLEVGTQMEAAMAGKEEADLTDWTSEDFTAVSEALAGVKDTLDAMEVPPVAAEFHAALTTQVDLLTQMFATMSTAGIFGALIYAEQIDAATAQTEAAAAAIETACGVDLSGELGMEEPAATPSAEIGGVEAVSPVAETGAGTRENPIPVGQTAALGEDWELTVLSVEPDATAAVMAESTFNDPPAPGHQFFMATVRVTYVGASSDEFYGGSLRVVGQSAVAYDSWDDYCGSIPNELADRELFTGGTIEGNLCWSVATADVDSLVLYDSFEFSDERVFFSLVPGAAGAPSPASPETASTGASGGFRETIAGAVTQMGGDSGSAAHALAITDAGFQPSLLMLATTGLPATIAVSNTASTSHTFTIVELDIDITIEPGATAQITIPAGTLPGDYSFESAPGGSTEPIPKSGVVTSPRLDRRVCHRRERIRSRLKRPATIRLRHYLPSPADVPHAPG